MVDWMLVPGDVLSPVSVNRVSRSQVIPLATQRLQEASSSHLSLDPAQALQAWETLGAAFDMRLYRLAPDSVLLCPST
jgi:hypothetical protein